MIRSIRLAGWNSAGKYNDCAAFMPRLNLPQSAILRRKILAQDFGSPSLVGEGDRGWGLWSGQREVSYAAHRQVFRDNPAGRRADTGHQLLRRGEAGDRAGARRYGI